jgi:transposase
LQLFSIKNGIKNLVLVLDNASFHKAKKIVQLVKSYGFKLLFLSPYSPDLNPIEHQWWVLKFRLAKIRTEFENFWDDLKYVLWSMSYPQV